MSDIALLWDNDFGTADLGIVGGDLATDDGLRTAFLISLFSDAPARADDAIADGETRGGWWGDAFAAGAPRGRELGSRLWVFAREKRLASVLAAFRSAAAEAVQWLIDDQVCSAINVTAELVGDASVGIGIEAFRPTGPARLRYDFTWEQSL